MGDHDFLGPDRPRHDGLNLLKAGESPEVLPTDSRLWDDPLEDYPLGMSVMRAEDSDLVDSFGYEMDIGIVMTFRSSADANPGDEIGTQLVMSNSWIFHRFWNDTTNLWGIGDEWATNSDISALPIEPATVDTIAENAAIGSWSSNKMTIMHASAAANYGPNSSEPGMVITEAIVTAGSDVSARQVFIRSSDGRPYVRYHDGTSWTSWRDDDPQNAIEAHSRVPTQDENDALQGTNGSPSGSNRYVTDSDARNTNARTPTSHASSHQPGGGDAMAVDAAAGTGSLRTLGTGATQALPGNHSSTTDARTPTTREWDATFFFGGNLTTQTGVGGDSLPNSGTPTITEVSAFVNGKPATQNVIIDINSVNLTTGAKTTLYTTQGNRPAITPAGSHRVNATLPDITQPGVGSVLTCDIDQVGTGTPGANLTVKVRGTY